MPMPDEWGEQQVPDPFETEEMKAKRLKREEEMEKAFKQLSEECPTQELPEWLSGKRKEGAG